MACTSPEPEPEPPDLQCDIAKLFEDRCGGSICHGAGESTAASLDLTSPGVEDRVSGAPGKSCVGVLANPASPESSLLYTKVLDAPSCGSRMPLTGDPLTEDEQTCLRDWISGLLPPGSNNCDDCACEPGVVEDCYSGPEGTADVGMCVSGSHTCQTSGMAFSACEGEVGPRGEDCFTADIDENCDGLTPECSEIWAIGFGGELFQTMRGVQIDPAGNVFGFGDFEGVVSFGGEPLTATEAKADLVLTKHDHFGNPLWSARYGDSSNQYSAKLVLDAQGNLVLLGRIYGAVDFGGGLLTAKGAGDLLVVKLDGQGQHLWSHVYGDKDPDRGERMVVDGQGNVFVTGTFTTSIDFGGGPLMTAGMRDAFVVELDGATGAQVFARQIGGVGDDYGFGIDVAANGDVVVAGRFQDTVQLGGALTSAGGRDMYLAKLDSAGAPIWSRSFGGAGEDEVHDLHLQDNGDIVMLGSMAESMNFGGPELVSAGLRDIFVASLDPDGNHVWSANYGDALDPFAASFEINSWMSMTLDSSGAIHVGASLVGTLDFDGVLLAGNSETNPDAFYFALAADGSYLGGSRYGGTGSDLILDLAVTNTGHVVLAGRTHGSKIDFEAAGLVPAFGSGDGFLAKLATP